MGGNVAEWVADVYRPIINNDVSDLNYYRGNLYKKPVINEDGKTKIVDKVIIDTMANNKLAVKALPGDVVFSEIDKNDSQLRINFNEAYNADFLDGDVQSNPNGDADEMYKFAVNKKGEQLKENEKVK